MIYIKWCIGFYSLKFIKIGWLIIHILHLNKQKQHRHLRWKAHEKPRTYAIWSIKSRLELQPLQLLSSTSLVSVGSAMFTCSSFLGSWEVQKRTISRCCSWRQNASCSNEFWTPLSVACSMFCNHDNDLQDLVRGEAIKGENSNKTEDNIINIYLHHLVFYVHNEGYR